MPQVDWLFSLVALVVALAVWLKFYLNKKYEVWSSQAVPGPSPFPFLGDLHKRITGDVIQFEIDMAAKYGKTYGTYIGLKPALIISDPELLKIIFVKDFPNFVNRFKFEAIHPLWGENLLFSTDEKWKRVRAITTPTFSSGKLKLMRPQMDRCISNLVIFLDDVVDKKNGIFDTKTVISGLTMDIIAATAFCTEINSNFETNTKGSFVVMGRRMFNQQLLKGFALMLLPKSLLTLLRLEHPFHDDAFQFFIDLTRHIVKERRQSGVKRNDLVQMMIDASVDTDDLLNYEKMAVSTDASDTQTSKFSSSQEKHKLTDTEIIANLIFFLLAGFETTSSAISHCLFSLAHNPDIQDRLYKEITETLKKTNDSDTFEAIITQMPLLEAALKETLRLYPPVPNNSRLCGTDNYRLGDITLNKDYLIGIPVMAVHYNPEYFPDPYKFNPDRFLPENKHNLVPYTYIPFGMGSRNCVGSRFAYQEMKLCLAEIIRQYRICCAPETPEKLSFVRTNNLLNSVNFPLKVEKR